MKDKDKFKEINRLTEGEEYEKALQLIENHLKNTPEDTELLLRKSKLLKRLQKFGPALNTIQEVLKKDPGHKEAKNVRDMIREILRYQQLDIYASTNLSNDPWLDD